MYVPPGTLGKQLEGRRLDHLPVMKNNKRNGHKNMPFPLGVRLGYLGFMSNKTFILNNRIHSLYTFILGI